MSVPEMGVEAVLPSEGKNIFHTEDRTVVTAGKEGTFLCLEIQEKILCLIFLFSSINMQNME